MKKIATIAGIVLILGLIAFRLAANKKNIDEKNKTVDRSAIAVPVTVATVSEGSMDGALVVPAVVKAGQEVNITLNASGKVKDLQFDLGSRVTKGQTIGSLDNSLKLISLESAQLLAEKNKTDYERLKELYQGKAATEVDYRNAKYNYENAQSQVAQIRQQISDASILSPLTGVITKKNVDEGEFVNMGATVATVVDISRLKASVMVSERDVYQLKENMPVLISTDVYPGKEFRGSVRFVNPSGDESHNYEVEVVFDNEAKSPLKAGTFITVKFDVNSQGNALLIPKIALAEGTKNPYVYVVSGKKALVRKIMTGRDLGNTIEVLSGLQAGDLVITSGQININDNSIIEVINESKH